MGRRGRGLASRFRRAVEQRNEAKQEEAERERRALERAARERSRLFDDLVAFADEAGFLQARLRDGALTLVHGARELRFVPVGDADAVEVDFEGRDPEERHRLYLEAQLDNAWVWGKKRRMRPREDRELFWDAGLEELLVVGLGLPRPGDDVEVDDEDVEPGARGKSL